jgi:hypothetical protein
MVDDYLWIGELDEFFQSNQSPGAVDNLDQLVSGRTSDLEWWQNNYKTKQKESLGKYWWYLGVHLTPGVNQPTA